MWKIAVCICLCCLLLGCKGSEQRDSSVRQSSADDSVADSADTEVRFSPPRSIAKVEANKFKGKPFAIGVADFDKDGAMDIVMMQDWCQWDGFMCTGFIITLVLYHGDGLSGFSHPEKFADVVLPKACYTEAVMRMTTVDFDGDGDQDLVANCFGDILFYENVTTNKEAVTHGGTK